MADPKKPDIQDIPKEPLIRKRSYRDIIAAGRKRVATGNEDDGEPIKPEEPKKEEKKEEKKNPIEEKARAMKSEEEIRAEARQAARDEIAKEQKEKEEKAKKEQEEADRKKELEAKKQPPWRTDPNRPKDKDGNPLPKSYDEIYDAAKEAAKAEIREELRQQREQEDAERKAKETADKAAEDEKKKAQEAVEAQINKQIDDEYADLVATGKMPKIADEKNKDDAGLKEKQKLFEAGMKVNQERIAKGLPIITSIKLIYYEHYKPGAQPPGATAPVLGTETASVTPQTPAINYSDIHNKSWRQILHDGVKRALGQSE